MFVAGDLLWYPLEGDPLTRVAPDVLVAFGRPKGHRGSYRQWQEGDIAPQVVFEVLSPGNTVRDMTVREMHDKRDFYERYGVEEYYLYDPDGALLAGWVRAGEYLDSVLNMRGWVSPRLGVTFDLEGTDLVLTRPDGLRLQRYVDVEAAREQAEAARARAEDARQQAEAAYQQAEARAAHLAARLRELGVTEDEL